MGRTKGTKNRVGHKAGGSRLAYRSPAFSQLISSNRRRKGAGRKPKLLVNGTRPPSIRVVEQPTMHSSPSGSSVPQNPSASREAAPIIPSINDNFINDHETPSSLALYPDIPHHVYPVTPTSDSQTHASASPIITSQCPQSSQLVWDSVPCEPPPIGCNNSPPMPSHFNASGSPTITTQRPRSSQLVWGSVPCEPSSTACNNSPPVPSHFTYNSQSPSQFTALFESYLSANLSSGCSEIEPNPPSESPTSRSIHPLDDDDSPVVDLDMSTEFTQCYSPLPSSETRLDSQPPDLYDSSTVVPPSNPAHSLPSQSPAAASASRPIVTRDTFVRIAPAPSSHEQRTGMFPDHLFPSTVSPVNCLAIISSTPAQKRRRRRCVVCLQIGREEASYECPGRGDRTRCPSRREDGVELNISELKQQRRCDQKAKYQNKALLSMSSGLMSTSSPVIGDGDVATYAPNSSQSMTETVASKAVLTTHILYPPIVTQPYVSLVPYGYPMHPNQQFVLAPGENAKRRSRRCMICVTQDKDGTHCPGRGNRILCPNREGEMDLLGKEQEGKEA